MDAPFDRRVETMEAAFQIVETIVEGGIRLAREDRLVDLNVANAGAGEGQNLGIQGRRQIAAEAPGIAVMVIGNHVGDGHRPRQGYLERAPGEGLRDLPIVDQKRRPGADPSGHRRQAGRIGAAA